MSADPIFEALSPTQTGGYDYAGNSPVTAEDPSGDAMITDGSKPIAWRNTDKVFNPGVECIHGCTPDSDFETQGLVDSMESNLGENPDVINSELSDDDFLATLKVFANYYNSIPNGKGYINFSVLIQETDVQVGSEVQTRVIVYSSGGTIPQWVLNALPKRVIAFKATGSLKDKHFEDAQASLEDDPELQEQTTGGTLGDYGNEFGTAMPCSPSCSELSEISPATYGTVELPGFGPTELTGGRGTVLAENWGGQSWNGEEMPNKPINQLICAIQGNPTNAEIAQAAENAEIAQEVSGFLDSGDIGVGSGVDQDINEELGD